MTCRTRRTAALSQRLIRLGTGPASLCLASAAGVVAQAQTAANAPTPDSVVVTGRRPSLVTLTEKLQNVAQTISVAPKQVLEDQGVASLQDALKNAPGITMNAGEGGSHGDSINLRGFPASDDFFLDGLRDTGFYTRDAFNLDAIEVYKGPASTLFGRGSTGGVVNQVSKTPKLSAIDDASLTVGSADEVRATADVNDVLGPSSALRVNLMGQRSGVVDRDFVLNQRFGVAPSLAIGLNQPTTATFSYIHEEENNIPDYGIPFVFGKPAPVPRQTYYGLPSDDRTKTRVDIGTFKFSHEFNDQLSFTDAARIGNYWFDTRQTAPHYGAAPPAIGTPLSAILIYRDRPSVGGTVATLMNEAAFTDHFTTGPLSHTLVVGLDLDRETASLVRYANQLSQIAPTPLLDPNPFEAFPGHETAISQRPTTRTETVSGFVLDTIEIGPHWQVVGGLRYDRFDANFNEPITAASYAHVDDIPSPRAAVIYKPTAELSFYASYGTSYDPSAENLSLSARTADLGPEKDRSYEVGAKSAWRNGMLTLTGAVFSTEMTNARVGDPLNATLQVLDGDQRVDGFELGASGYLTRHWEILAGYTYLDARTVKSTDPTQVGQPLPNTTPNQANIWSSYEFGEDWKVGAGVNYLGQRAADASGRDHVPGYVTLDGMASYRVSPKLTLQINVYNLTDVYYFTNSYDSSPVENHVIPGPGRTVTLTALAHF